MRIINSILIAMILLLYISCKKNVIKGNTTAQVYVQSPTINKEAANYKTYKGAGKPIPNAKVFLYGGYTSGGFLSGNSSLNLIETYYTDSSGYVFIDFKNKDYKDEDYDFFTLRAAKDLCHLNRREYDLKKKYDNLIIINLSPQANLYVHIKNVTEKYYSVEFEGKTYNGPWVIRDINKEVLGDDIEVLNFYHYSQGELIHSKTDSIFCPSFETIDYYYEY